MSDDSSSRIAVRLKEWIAGAPPGSRLPSTRELVSQYQASPVTIQKVLRKLGSEGLIESRPGVGTFVRIAPSARPSDFSWQTAALGSLRFPVRSLTAAMRTAPNDVVAFHSGYPDRELLPERLVRAALARAARSDAAIFKPSTAGLPELQSWFANELRSATPAGVMPPASSDVIIVPGSQSGLSSIFGALAGSGRPVLMESPTYWGAIRAAEHTGVEVTPIPSDADGPNPEELARAFEETGARLFYAQPNYANPTGAQWSPQRSEQVLEVVRQHGAFMVEDDWAHDFGITATSVPIAARDDAGHVIYLRSLTKSVSPAIRVAAVIARGPARDRILADQTAESMYVSGIMQSAALDVVTQPAWQTHLRGLRHQLQSRRDLLATSLRRHAPRLHIAHLPKGGLNLWAQLPDGTDLERFTRDCESAGVLISPGTEWFPTEPPGPYIRLNYSGPNPASFAEGTRILNRALDNSAN